MAEQVDLTSPVTPPTLSFYRVTMLTLDWVGQTIYIGLTGTNGEQFSAGYAGAEAVNLMTTLNTANLSITSLHKRILNKLIADGKISGTVRGTP